MSKYTAQALALPAQDENPFRADRLSLAMATLHGAIIGYVLIGWYVESRAWLFVYTLVLPLIVLQWLCNRGVSVVQNWENMRRTGHWYDERNPYQGCLFQRAFEHMFGFKFTRFQVNVIVVAVMAFLWKTAFFHMLMIQTAPGAGS